MCSPVAHQRTLWVGGLFCDRSEAGPGMAGSSGDAVSQGFRGWGQNAGPTWVQQTKRRMPRHRDEAAEEEWLLSKEIPSGERWFHAQQIMLNQIHDGKLMKMKEAFDILRRDLSTTRVAWYPQKWTTMVEGRPTQVQLCILPYNPLAEPDARRAKCHGHGGLPKDIFKKKVFFSETCMSEAIPNRVM